MAFELDIEPERLVKSTDRAAVGMMLEGLGGTVDLIVPRGGKGLTGRVINEARLVVVDDENRHKRVHCAPAYCWKCGDISLEFSHRPRSSGDRAAVS